MTNAPPDPDDGVIARPTRPRLWALLAGPVAFAVTLAMPAPAGMAPAAWLTAGLGLWMAIWWSSEALPVPVTALLPLIALPLAGIAPIETAASLYAHPLIFLFLGGFLLALGIQKHGLHRRLALNIVARTGTRPAALVAGFMTATGLLSMWVSNTATAMLMLPIGLSVIAEVRGETPHPSHPHDDPFAIALLLGIAYGASIGGLGTLIGTPPNALLAAYAETEFGIRIGFARWMLVGVPMALVMGFAAWLILTRTAFRLNDVHLAAGQDAIARHLEELGSMSANEKRVALLFLVTAALWLTRPWLTTLPGLAGLNDSSIAIGAGFALFLLPTSRASGNGGRLIAWTDAASLPWGTLLLFGGGLSLAGAIGSSGLAGWIGDALTGFADWPLLALVALIAAIVVFLTELTSNTATTAAFLPLMGALALVAGLPPLMLMAPAALAASAAFMLPVATPPNAIVHGSGMVPIPAMMRAGFALNIATILLVTAMVPLLLGLIFTD
jgi:sodium-dependent dicarboxylate transporter 2/3/5